LEPVRWGLVRSGVVRMGTTNGKAKA
jgi:hypothetical protein